MEGLLQGNKEKGTRKEHSVRMREKRGIAKEAVGKRRQKARNGRDKRKGGEGS